MSFTTSLPTSGGLVRRLYSPLLSRTTWKETASLLLALPTGVLWFSVAVTGLSVAAGLLVTVVGVPLLAGVVLCGRLIGATERATARALLDTDLPPFPPFGREGSWWARTRRALGDRPSRKGLAYGLASLPVGIATFTTAVVLWSVAIASTAFPAYQAFLTESDMEDVPDAFSSLLDGWGRVGASAGVGVFGLVLLALTPRILHRVADLQRSLVRRFLSPGAAH